MLVKPAPLPNDVPSAYIAVIAWRKHDGDLMPLVGYHYAGHKQVGSSAALCPALSRTASESRSPAGSSASCHTPTVAFEVHEPMLNNRPNAPGPLPPFVTLVQPGRNQKLDLHHCDPRPLWYHLFAKRGRHQPNEPGPR
jgi:hypothetical protein